MKAAILGFGTVGSGAYEVISRSSEDIFVKRVLDIRPNPDITDKLTNDISDIISDDEIVTVAETMGGLHPAFEYVSSAMMAGKNVVTSNKKLVAAYYEELMSLAARKNVAFRFSAAAGGGIPWLSNIIRRSVTENIDKIQGIINGTTNYVLDSMETRGISFVEALLEAQKLGYAERDPSSDIDGEDLRFKCAISASCAFGMHISEADIPVLSLRNVKKEDIDYARKNGMCIKYMTFAARKDDGAFSAYVEPVMINSGALESAVHLNNNIVSLFGEYSGKLSFFGQGAGKYPTGAAIAYDVIEISKSNNFPIVCGGRGTVENSEELHRYYIRTKDKDADIEKISDSYVKNGDYFVAVTREISVFDINKIKETVLKSDDSAFFAGIHPEI